MFEQETICPVVIKHSGKTSIEYPNTNPCGVPGEYWNPLLKASRKSNGDYYVSVKQRVIAIVSDREEAIKEIGKHLDSDGNLIE